MPRANSRRRSIRATPAEIGGRGGRTRPPSNHTLGGFEPDDLGSRDPEGRSVRSGRFIGASRNEVSLPQPSLPCKGFQKPRSPFFSAPAETCRKGSSEVRPERPYFTNK